MARVTLSVSEFQRKFPEQQPANQSRTNQQITHAAKLEVSPVTPHTVLKRLKQPTRSKGFLPVFDCVAAGSVIGGFSLLALF